MPVIGMPKKSVGHIPRFDHSTCETKNHSPFFLSCQRQMVKRRCDAAVWDTTYTVVGDSWNIPFDRILPYIYNPYHKLLFYIGTIVLIKIVHWLKSKVDQLHSLNLCDVRLLDRRHRQLRHSRRRVLRSRQRLDQSPVAAKTQRDRTPQRHPNG